MKRVTLDSNIYLSALVFGGKPKRILEMAIEGEIEAAVSDPIIEEVQRHLLGKFGFPQPGFVFLSCTPFLLPPARRSVGPPSI